MKIYRYESVDTGEGPYQKDSPLHDLLMHGTPDDIRHRTWEQDELLTRIAKNREYRAAFASRRDLALWFKGYHEDLLTNGFQLVCYVVPTHAVRKAYRGHQIAFVGTKARERVVLVPHAVREP